MADDLAAASQVGDLYRVMQGTEHSGCGIQLSVREYTQLARHVARQEGQNFAPSIVNSDEARCTRKSARCSGMIAYIFHSELSTENCSMS